MKITKFTSTLLVTSASLGGLSANAKNKSFEQKWSQEENVTFQKAVKLEAYDSLEIDIDGKQKFAVTCSGNQTAEYRFTNYEVKVEGTKANQITTKEYGEYVSPPSGGC
ncbi:MAG TPA: hypothetical protein VM901_08410 [Bdellovibrionota bacterium]|jgi:hypothetical protein|nr:hypothetical protein [Bdellovibrionota bacterium]